MRKRIFCIAAVSLLSCPFLFSLGQKEAEGEVVNVTDSQDLYKALSVKVPAIALLGTVGTSACADGITARTDEIIAHELVKRGRMKPVSAREWLEKSYSKKKADSPSSFLRAVADERFGVPLVGFLSSHIYLVGERYFLHLDYYSLSDGPYPITVVRTFLGEGGLADALSAGLDEFERKFKSPPQSEDMKKVIVNRFAVTYRRLVTLESGEFEFVETPFIERGGTSLREGDEFLSRIIAYSMNTTFMFRCLHSDDLGSYVADPVKSNANADYILDGKVQFTDRVSLLTLVLRDAKSGNPLCELKFPFNDFDERFLWDSARDLVARLVADRFDAGKWAAIPELAADACGFWCRDSFIGWDRVTGLVLPRGRFRLDTGDFRSSTLATNPIPSELPPGANVKVKKSGILFWRKPVVVISPPRSFFVFIDDRAQIYKDREGEYFWKVLDKKE